MLSRLAAAAGRALLVASGNVAAPSAWHVEQSVPACRRLLLQQPRAFSTNSTDLFNIHRNEPGNDQDSTFSFTPANRKIADDLIANYPPNYKASAIIPVLDLAQQQNSGWLTLGAMKHVATLLDMPDIRVYEVATFYTMFNRSKIGRYHVMVCGTTPCRLQGAEKIEEAIRNHLGIHVGETTKDGLFTLGEMECMGACVNAPMVAIADYSNGVEGYSYEYYEDLTPSDVVGILETLKKGGQPKKGSQHREKAAPAGAVVGDKWVPMDGLHTLTGTPAGPYCRDLP